MTSEARPFLPSFNAPIDNVPAEQRALALVQTLTEMLAIQEWPSNMIEAVHETVENFGFPVFEENDPMNPSRHKQQHDELHRKLEDFIESWEFNLSPQQLSFLTSQVLTFIHDHHT